MLLKFPWQCETEAVAVVLHFTSLSCFYHSEKVFRLKPALDEHVTLIKDLAKDIEVPVWILSLTQVYTLT